MRIAVAVLVALIAAPAMAEEGRVSQSTLALMGLSEMEAISDESGHEVRGRSSFATANGVNLVFGTLLDPNTGGNFLAAADTNGARTDATNAGPQVTTIVLNGPNGSAITGNLGVANNQIFMGSFVGLGGTAALPGFGTSIAFSF